MATPTKFAVVKISNHQYKVVEGEELDVQKIEGKKGDNLKFDEILLKVDNDKIEIGQPLVKSSSVSAEIVDQIKGEKVKVFKFKAKSRYRKTMGHRQNLTKIKVTKIS